MKKIAVFGGSFDPVHCGHVRLALSALQEGKVHTVVFLPAGIPPHKHRLCVSIKHRLQMLRLAVGKHKQCIISRYEIDRKKTTFTRQSIRYFKKRYKRSTVFFLVGGDSLLEMRSWYGGYSLLKELPFLVGMRPGVSIPCTFKKNKGSIIILRGRMPNISATRIRSRIKRNLSIKGLVPEQVRKYIRKNKLYA